jgi:hypothetical protein
VVPEAAVPSTPLDQALDEVEAALTLYQAEITGGSRDFPKSADRYLSRLASELENVADTLKKLSELETHILTLQRESSWIPPTVGDLAEHRNRCESLASHIRRTILDLKRTRKRPSAAEHRAKEHLGARLADVWERYTVGDWTIGHRRPAAWPQFVAAVFKIAAGPDSIGKETAYKIARERHSTAE